MKKQKLKIIPIGGTTSVQKNLFVYESGNDIMVVDCGIGFPDLDTPGVDVTIPDFTYVLENRDRVKGIVITHGHDDHKASLQYLLRKHKFDVYAMPFVKGLILKSFEEYTDLDKVVIKEINPDQPFRLGVFKLHPYRVNHSIPDTLGFAIDTPAGRVFHNTDFKFDPSPVMDKPFEVDKVKKLANEQGNLPIALLSDCLGSTKDGFSKSEKFIQEEFEKLFLEAREKQLIVTTMSSNISRIYQAIAASIKVGRKVVISGRSMRNSVEVAKKFGYIDFDDSVFVDDRKASKMPQENLTYIITGCYAQRFSGLVRLANDEHRQMNLENNAVVIFSADPIPNSVGAVNKLIDTLYLHGADVSYSEIQGDLHVSGHGLRGDLLKLAKLVNPKYFIPIGGNIKHMRAYADLLIENGVNSNNILQLIDGQTAVLENGIAKPGKIIKVRDVYVDGNLVGDVGTSVIKDRIKMANSGMVVVVIYKDRVEIVTRGFVFAKASQDLLKEANIVVKKRLKNKKGKESITKNVERALSKFFYKETGREPLILVRMV